MAKISPIVDQINFNQLILNKVTRDQYKRIKNDPSLSGLINSEIFDITDIEKLNALGDTIINVADPSLETDATNKKYVDTAISKVTTTATTPATKESLGVVKVGNGIDVKNDGTISAKVSNTPNNMLSVDETGIYVPQLDVAYSQNGTLDGLTEKPVLQLKNKQTNTVISELDVTNFIKDGMLDSAQLSEDKKSLNLTFNTDSGKEIIKVDVSKLIDVYKAGNGLTATQTEDGGTEFKVDYTKVAQHSDISAAIKTLDSEITSVGTGKVIDSITETDGKLTATTRALSSSDISDFNSQVDSKINSLNDKGVTAGSGDGQFVGSISQSNGKITATLKKITADDIPELTSSKISDFETAVKGTISAKTTTEENQPVTNVTYSNGLITATRGKIKAVAISDFDTTARKAISLNEKEQESSSKFLSKLEYNSETGKFSATYKQPAAADISGLVNEISSTIGLDQKNTVSDSNKVVSGITYTNGKFGITEKQLNSSDIKDLTKTISSTIGLNSFANDGNPITNIEYLDGKFTATTSTIPISSISNLQTKLDELSTTATTKATKDTAGIVQVGTGIDVAEGVISIKADSKTNNIASVTDAGIYVPTFKINYKSGTDNTTGSLKGKPVIELIKNGEKEELVSSIDATNFVKDGLLESAELVEPSDVDTKTYIKLTFNTVDGVAKEPIKLDVTKLIDIYTVSNGLKQTDGDPHKFEVNFDIVASNESVNNKINALSATTVTNDASAQKTTPVFEISQTAGKVSYKTRALVSTDITDLDTTINGKINAIAAEDVTAAGEGSTVNNVTYKDGKITVSKGKITAATVSDFDATAKASAKQIIGGNTVSVANGKVIAGVSYSSETGQFTFSEKTLAIDDLPKMITIKQW